MKIYASKLDDLRQKKAEWDAETQRRENIRREQRQNYRKAVLAITDVIEAEIYDKLNQFTSLSFDVDVEEARYGKEGLRVRIRCNDRRLFDEDSAMTWSYDVELDGEGGILKETNSHSGLRAATESQMKSLVETVEALKLLNSLNWKEIVDVETPDYSDFYTEEFEDRGPKPNFDWEIKQEELREIIAQGKAVKGRGLESLGYGRGAKNVWYYIKRETPKQYEVTAFSGYEIDRHGFETPEEALEFYKDRYSSRVKKENLIGVLYYPFETLG